MQYIPFRSLQDVQDTLFNNLNDNVFSRWLYEDDWSEKKLQQFELLHTLPVVGNYMDYLLDYRADKEYLQRYGMDYSDIHDPRKLSAPASFGGFAHSGFNFVSKNVDKLYR